MKQMAAVVGVGLGLLAGCAAPMGPSSAASSGGAVASVAAGPETAATPDTTGERAAPITVTLQGQVVGSDGTARAGVGVFRLALDPYLVPVIQTRTDTAGTFSLAGATADTREWLLFQLPGDASLYEAFDTSDEGQQVLPAVTLFTDAEVTRLAQSFGAQLDAARSIVRVPVVVAVAEGVAPLAAGEIQVSFTPPIDTPVVLVDGAALAFNAAPSTLYDVAVSRGGKPCAPQGHPELVAADGSVPLATFAGGLTVAPAVLCPSR